jgi:hypothetical protein
VPTYLCKLRSEPTCANSDQAKRDLDPKATKRDGDNLHTAAHHTLTNLSVLIPAPQLPLWSLSVVKGPSCCLGVNRRDDQIKLPPNLSSTGTSG